MKTTGAFISLLKDLYQKSQFLNAYALLKQRPPAEEWTDPDEQLIAARLILMLGDSSRAIKLFYNIWNSNKNSDEYFYFYAQSYLSRHGYFEGLRLIDEHITGENPSHSPQNRYEADLFLLKAYVLSRFRDFDASTSWLNAAATFLNNDPWFFVQKTYILLSEDKYDEALKTVELAFKMQPDYRPTIEAFAFVLSLTNNDEKAIDLLGKATSYLQSAGTSSQLAMLLIEQGRWDDALKAILQTEKFCPLADFSWKQLIHQRKAEIFYQLKRYPEALQEARLTKGSYYENFVKKIESLQPGEATKRIHLPVGFIRQHHMTCAPATISAISQYLKYPIDHLSLAEVITYDGTPSHEERHWLENNGWFVREFTVNWDILKKLIDNNIPFSMVVTWVKQSHLQAVIGYDDILKSIIIRDPYHRNFMEVVAEEFFKEQEPYGPRGLLMLPVRDKNLVQDIDFPDTIEYDHFYSLCRKLLERNREEANLHLSTLKEIAPDHYLTSRASYMLAGFDNDYFEARNTLLKWREKYPDDQNASLALISNYKFLGREQEYITLLKECTIKANSHYCFWQLYAEILSNDNREHRRAGRYARRLLHYCPLDSENLRTYANFLWDDKEFEFSRLLYRLSACMNEGDESIWNSFFLAYQHLGKSIEAIRFLEKRAIRTQKKSSYPAITLSHAYKQISDYEKAISSLKHAFEFRPKDGVILLELAELYARLNRFKEANDTLLQAKDICSDADWMQCSAVIASWQGNFAKALECWKENLNYVPLHIHALRQTCDLIHSTQGIDNVLIWLKERIIKYTHFLPLRQLYIETLLKELCIDPIEEIDSHLDLFPNDAWILCEKAQYLANKKQTQEAVKYAKHAYSIAPNENSAETLGNIYLQIGDKNKAKECFKHELKRSIDSGNLIYRYVHSFDDFEERKSAVYFIFEQLCSQSFLGQSYIDFKDTATGILSSEEITNILNKLREKYTLHPRLYVASIQQAIETNDLLKAKELCTKAIEIFPLQALIWKSKADIHLRENEPEKEIAALKKALEINQEWTYPAIRLAAIYERMGNMSEAKKTLEQAHIRNPLDPVIHLKLASLYWEQNEKEKAFSELKAALNLNFDYDDAWTLLNRWNSNQDETLSLAETLAAKNPTHAGIQIRYALELNSRSKYENALIALNKVLHNNPRHAYAHDVKARTLLYLNRFEEAIACCFDPIFSGNIPIHLQGMAAYIEWNRGHNQKAINDLESLLQKHPDYGFGYQLLSEWYLQKNETEKASIAAQNYAKIEPNTPYPLGFAADILMASGKKDQAIDYLQQALRIDNSYLFSSSSLLKIFCEQKNFNDAKQMLEFIRRYDSEWSTLYYEILLHLSQSNYGAANISFSKLLCVPESEVKYLYDAKNEYSSRNRISELKNCIEYEIQNPRINPRAGSIWVDTFTEQNTTPHIQRLKKKKAGDPVLYKAYFNYLSWLSEKGRNFVFLLEVFEKRKWFRKNTETWGIIGYGLVNQSKLKSWMTCLWLRDWRERKDVEQWMVWNLALYYANFYPSKSVSIAEEAIKRFPNSTFPQMISFLAFEYAVRKEWKKAKETLAISSDNSGTYSKILLLFAEEIYTLFQTPISERKKQYKVSRKNILSSIIEHPNEYRHKFLDSRRQRTNICLAELAHRPITTFCLHIGYFIWNSIEIILYVILYALLTFMCLVLAFGLIGIIVSFIISFLK